MFNIVKSLSLVMVLIQFCGAQHVHETGALREHSAPHYAEVAHPEFPIELGLSAAWESHYVAEGRDSLDGDGLTGVEGTVTYKGVTLGAWGAESPDVDYREYNYWVEYIYTWERLSIAVSYTYLDFDTDDEDDHEYALWLTYSLPEGFEFTVGGYYSDASDAAFYEATLYKSIDLNGAVSVTPFASLGYNDGYVVEGHEGLNHFAIGVELSYQFCEHFSMRAFIAGTLEIDADEDRYADDELLEDFAFGGVSLSFTY